MHFFKKKIHRLKELKKEKSVTMACLYASPEEMRKINDLKERTDVYPFVHAVDPDKTGQFCVNCGKFVSMSTVICPYCGNNVQIARDTESLMVSVYASPEMMSKTEKKKSFFSKLFSRKK